ncbi:MAG: RNA 3'-phosphate cyclase, partial [Proteobacteria bacterium]
MTTIVIDGSHGEGGGQIIRTSVALSALLGARTIVENIRPRREPPGLQRTHLEAIRGIASLAGVVLEGDALGSVRLVLNPPPQPPLGEQWRPSSHATSLIVQTVLGPSLAVASTTSRILTKSAPTTER